MAAHQPNYAADTFSATMTKREIPSWKYLILGLVVSYLTYFIFIFTVHASDHSIVFSIIA